MPERQSPKTGLSPSPVLLALFILIVAIVMLGAITLSVTGITAPVQTGVVAKPDQGQNKQSNQQNALAAATATALDDEDPNYATRVLPVPTDAELPPGFTLPTPLPPPTEIKYTPGPTANLEKAIPIEEWKEYVNEKQGFLIEYPPDWYLNAGATGQTTQLFSYDFNDPALMIYKGPPLGTKIEIMVNRVDGAPVEQFQQDETISDWVHRRRPLDEGDKLMLEEEVKVDGLPALRQVKKYDTGETVQVVYVKRAQDVILIVQYYYQEDLGVLNEIFAQFVRNFKITK